MSGIMLNERINDSNTFKTIPSHQEIQYTSCMFILEFGKRHVWWNLFVENVQTVIETDAATEAASGFMRMPL
jgi:hypothetical protein